MTRLLLEICPDDAAANGAAAGLAPILICAHEGQDAIAFEGTLGGKPLILRFKDGAYALENPTDARNSVMGLGEWHVAEGWKLRVTQGFSTDANVSLATDDQNWAEPEFHVTTFNGAQTKRLRTVLPMGEGTEVIVGRDGSKAGLVIEDEHVSRAHFRFFVQDGKRLVEDLGSRWGTKLNGQPLTDARPLKHGDELRLGRTCINYICYMDIAEEPAPEAAEVPGAERRPPKPESLPGPVASPARADLPHKPVGPALADPLEQPTMAIKPGGAPGSVKPPTLDAPAEAKPGQAGSTAASPVDKAAPGPAAVTGAPNAAKTTTEERNPASGPGKSQGPKTAAVPQAAAGAAASVPKTGPAAAGPPKSNALSVVGAAVVIVLMLAGVAYLGYQLFIRGH